MHDMTPPAGASAPAAASTAGGRPLSLGDWFPAPTGTEPERERLVGHARDTDAGRQLQRCLPRWSAVLAHLTWRALVRLAADEPLDPNDPGIWRSPDEHAQAVLRRHGITGVSSARLTMSAVRALIDGQARADRDAGLDWTRLHVPAQLDAPLRRAHATLALGLDDPSIYAHRDDQRRVLAARLGVSPAQADDLSRWLLTHPDAFDADDLRCWRIASPAWLALAGTQLPAVERVERPVGLLLVPAVPASDGWQLAPALSLDAIRLVDRPASRVQPLPRDPAAGRLTQQLLVGPQLGDLDRTMWANV